MSDFSNIPVINVSMLRSGDIDALADEFLRVYGQIGFGYIVGHWIDAGLVDRVFAASAAFHALPMAAKMAVELDANHRGFIPINTSTDVNSKLADVKKPNQSESFMVMREDGPDAPEVLRGDYLAGPNQWPDLAAFRDDVLAYNDALTGLGRDLMGVVALAIGSDPAELLGAFDPPTTWLRLLHYPPSEPDPTGDLYGSAPHTDFGCLTILAQDAIGGLQVMTPGGVWVDAPYIPGAFVVNVGDMLHRWSNGRLRSTPHRVINRSGRPRYSCPFFYDPSIRTDIAPLTSCVSGDAPARFPPINFGAFLRAELGVSYDKHKDSAG